MLVVTERPPSFTDLIVAEAQKKWGAKARKKIAKLEAEVHQAQQEIAKREAEARQAQQEIAKREAEIAKLNAALIELAAKAKVQKQI